ncbi:MAG: preprotein translocase subunit YajC [Candidatus Delongbacteria bacterium]|jgi:preprotein translocase subunit YajC|nr:preprotein translocase subunit YajC [Candidatus Delongbacteria bacterium]
MNQLSIFLTMNPEGGSEQSPWSSFIFLALILVVFYFFMIRPQMKRQKEMRKFRENIKIGDKVVTTGGIHGKIKNIKETTIDIEVSDDLVITVEKTATNPVHGQQKGR